MLRSSFQLEPLQPVVESDRTLLLIHGYMNNHDAKADYKEYVQALSAAGWSGNVFGLYWDAGALAETIHQLAGRLTTIAIPLPGPWKATQAIRLGWAAHALLEHWQEACDRADAVGTRLGESLAEERLDLPGRHYWLVGHSLGCRVICQALRIAERPVVQEAWLFGGALPVAQSRFFATQSVRGRVLNVYSTNDPILRYLFRFVAFCSPIGLGPIPKKRRQHRRIYNLNGSALVRDHFSYEKVIPPFQGVFLPPSV